MSWRVKVLIPASGWEMARPNLLNMKMASLYSVALSMGRNRSFGLGRHILAGTVMMQVSGLAMLTGSEREWEGGGIQVWITCWSG
jgi:hypothetical protein